MALPMMSTWEGRVLFAHAWSNVQLAPSAQASEPITLPVPERLVLSVHSYGHFNFGYMRDAHFPHNLPAVFDSHFGWVLREPYSLPLIVGEWGGHWEATTWGARTMRETRRWQEEMGTWLRSRWAGSGSTTTSSRKR